MKKKLSASLIAFALALLCSGALARGAIRNINTVRDERWLAENPIDYA